MESERRARTEPVRKGEYNPMAEDKAAKLNNMVNELELRYINRCFRVREQAINVKVLLETCLEFGLSETTETLGHMASLSELKQQLKDETQATRVINRENSCLQKAVALTNDNMKTMKSKCKRRTDSIIKKIMKFKKRKMSHTPEIPTPFESPSQNTLRSQEVGKPRPMKGILKGMGKTKTAPQVHRKLMFKP